MKEKVLKIGGVQPLNGILTSPEVGLADPSRPVVLILNSGLMHHVGTSRMSVQIARALADIGYTSYRFDFSGIGDSVPRSGGRFIENAPTELIEVMDTLECQLGTGAFVCFGLCSGADVSFETAQKDPRIRGLVQIDPYVYRNVAWYIHHLLARLKDKRSWKNLLTRRIQSAKPNQSMVEVSEDNREFPARETVQAGYCSLIEGGAKFLVFLTSGQRYRLNHLSQFRAVFSGVPWGGALQEYYLPNAEHILPEPEAQRFVKQAVCEWIKAQSFK